jgi:hypothetical protein
LYLLHGLDEVLHAHGSQASRRVVFGDDGSGCLSLLLLLEEVTQRSHGGLLAKLLEIAPRVTRRDLGEDVDAEILCERLVGQHLPNGIPECERRVYATIAHMHMHMHTHTHEHDARMHAKGGTYHAEDLCALSFVGEVKEELERHASQNSRAQIVRPIGRADDDHPRGAVSDDAVPQPVCRRECPFNGQWREGRQAMHVGA